MRPTRQKPRVTSPLLALAPCEKPRRPFMLVTVDGTRDARPVCSEIEHQAGAPDLAARHTRAEACPKFSRCSAAYCPALGGTHLKGELLCHYLSKSVNVGGEARVRGCLPKGLADVVIREGLRCLNSTGPLNRPLKRASGRGSRIDSMKRAAQFKRPAPAVDHISSMNTGSSSATHGSPGTPCF
jgi:hypothetical protein